MIPPSVFTGLLTIVAYALILVFSILVILNFNKGLMSKGECVRERERERERDTS